jgi:hypothetical protein
VLDLRRTKSTENLHLPEPCEVTETEDLATATVTASMSASKTEVVADIVNVKNENEKSAKEEALR